MFSHGHLIILPTIVSVLKNATSSTMPLTRPSSFACVDDDDDAEHKIFILIQVLWQLKLWVVMFITTHRDKLRIYFLTNIKITNKRISGLRDIILKWMLHCCEVSVASHNYILWLFQDLQAYGNQNPRGCCCVFQKKSAVLFTFSFLLHGLGQSKNSTAVITITNRNKKGKK